MSITIRFFARFRELLGTSIVVDNREGTTLVDLVRDAVSENKEGFDAIFDDQGKLRDYVVLMRNGKRLDVGKASTVNVSNDDEIAVFPPVAGG
ncbi:MAG: ubiquitin-like small modifier protein 1 [Methanomicrobiales archaeon]